MKQVEDHRPKAALAILAFIETRAKKLLSEIEESWKAFEKGPMVDAIEKLFLPYLTGERSFGVTEDGCVYRKANGDNCVIGQMINFQDKSILPALDETSWETVRQGVDDLVDTLGDSWMKEEYKALHFDKKTLFLMQSLHDCAGFLGNTSRKDIFNTFFELEKHLQVPMPNLKRALEEYTLKNKIQ
jgi:hypothetical protein